MKVLYNLPPKETFKNFSLALGFFDGVHRAHQKLLDTVNSLARDSGAESAVITFQKSPGGYFDSKKNINLQTLEARLSLIEKRGIDYTFVLDFEDFKDMDATTYLNDVLIKYFSPKYIVTGFNHTFGANKSGSAAFLYDNQNSNPKHPYKYVEVEKMKVNNTLVSSTNVKKFLEKGYVKEANLLLGYDFNINGTVVTGMGLARKLGFKTANILLPDNIVKPAYGVYYGAVSYKDKTYNSLINWGIKPTVNNSPIPVLEAHILNFDGDIYGENITVSLKEYLREEKKFSTVEELKRAISDDVNKCIKYSY